MREFGVAFHWRRFRERYQLMGSRCKVCGTYFYPPRSFCTKCRRKGEVENVKLSGRGKVYTFTVIRAPPEDFKEYAPYIMAMVELEEGVKVTGQIVGCKPEDVKIGMEVRTIFRKIREEGSSGIILYGFKFTPAKK